MEWMADEPTLVAALLRGQPGLSRNRHFDFMSSEMGQRARRRAAFLRSIARDIEKVFAAREASMTIERGRFARGTIKLDLHHAQFTRRAYLTEDEIALLVSTFPRLAGVFAIGARSHDRQNG